MDGGTSRLFCARVIRSRSFRAERSTSCGVTWYSSNGEGIPEKKFHAASCTAKEKSRIGGRDLRFYNLRHRVAQHDFSFAVHAFQIARWRFTHKPNAGAIEIPFIPRASPAAVAQLAFVRCFHACPEICERYRFRMSTVKEIENAIARLSRDDLSELRAWFAHFDPDAWDRQIEEDARSGRLDTFYQRLERENEGQADIPLDEVLKNDKLS